jgi:hypothetical protein
MAAHLFGYGYEVKDEAMFRYTCKRQGWNTKLDLEVQPSGKTLAQEKFGRFKFEPVIMKMVEEKPDLDAPIPADPQAPEELPALPPRRKASAS